MSRECRFSRLNRPEPSPMKVPRMFPFSTLSQQDLAVVPIPILPKESTWTTEEPEPIWNVDGSPFSDSVSV